MEPLKIFIGYDHRQPVSYHVLEQSILENSSVPVAITPLVLDQLPLQRVGLTPFTYSRFLVPYLCDYKGWALFLDLDMVVTGDIANLFKYKDDKYSILVSKHGKIFEWASVMLFNCEKNKCLTPEYIEKAKSLHGIGWLEDEDIGAFPGNWNHLVGYDRPRDDVDLIHYTQGVPAFEVTQDSEHADKWHKYHRQINGVIPWEALMGPSVHAAKLPDGTLVPKYKVEPPV